MIEIICKIALLGLLGWNVYLATAAHGRLIGYIVDNYKDGDPPQVFSGHWQRFNSTPVVIGALIQMLLLYGAGAFPS